MRHLFVAGVLMGMLSGTASAQDVFKKPLPTAYFFAAPGVRVDTHQSTLEIGGGGEFCVYKGLGFGGALGGLRVPSSDSTGKTVYQWTGMAAFHTVYNFQRRAKQKVNPFVVLGFTIVPAFDTPGGYNLGGGVQYWFSSNLGLRVEFREHVLTGMRSHQYPQVRIGLAFGK
jgi:hypothetical protein